MTEKEKAAFEIVCRICADFLCNQKDRVVVQESLQILHAALNPKDDEKKIKVPKKALPRNHKKKV